jgi:hypothetical protein
LIKRHCKKILLSDKLDDIVTLIFQKLKNHNMIYVMQYLDNI